MKTRDSKKVGARRSKIPRRLVQGYEVSEISRLIQVQNLEGD